MFNNIFGGAAGSGQFSEQSIKQANEQLHQMHQRICELEQRQREQNELMNRRQEEYAQRYHQLEKSKDNEIEFLKEDLWKNEQKYAKLESMLKERDVQIAYMLHRCSYLDEAASYAPLLDQLANTLKSAFGSPSPKSVQQVRPTSQVVPHAQQPTPNMNQAHVYPSATQTGGQKKMGNDGHVNKPNQKVIKAPVTNSNVVTYGTG